MSTQDLLIKNSNFFISMISTNLSRCLAKICGDGNLRPNYVRYDNHCKELRVEFKEDMTKEFGKLHFCEGIGTSGTPYVLVGNQKIVQLFLQHLESFKSDKVDLPDSVLDSGIHHTTQFIRAFYDDEGCVALRFFKKTKEWKRSITLTSNSLKILRKIKKVLREININSNKIYRNNKNNIDDRSYVLSISGKLNIMQVRNKIGFKHPKKLELLDLIILSYSAAPKKGNIQCNTVLTSLEKIKKSHRL